MIYELFPIRVKTYTYPDHAKLKHKLKLHFEKHQERFLINATGTCSFWQDIDDPTMGLFKTLKYKEIKDFKAFCLESALDYATNVLEYDVSSMVCIGSWLNQYRATSGQDEHIHVNSFVSANYYLNFDNTMHSDLAFWNPQWPKHGMNNILMQKKKHMLTNTANYDYVCIPGQEGSVTFFPSWLEHSVNGHNNYERQTISMNFMPSRIVHESYGFDIKEI